MVRLAMNLKKEEPSLKSLETENLLTLRGYKHITARPGEVGNIMVFNTMG